MDRVDEVFDIDGNLIESEVVPIKEAVPRDLDMLALREEMLTYQNELTVPRWGRTLIKYVLATTYDSHKTEDDSLG